MKLQRLIALAGVLLLSPSLFADFQYQQKTQITGGSVVNAMKLAGKFSRQARDANEPVISTVYVKGNRMAHISSLHTEIIDLDRETITTINHQDKTWTVMTFQQFKERMQQAMRDADKQGKQSANDRTDVTFDVKVRNTGAHRQVSGLDTREAILNMTAQARDRQTGEQGSFAITNDMWMAPDIPGYGEVRDFYKRYAEKMGMMLGDGLSPQMAAMMKGSAKGFSAMAEEMAKLKGVPVLQITRMGSTADGKPIPAASEAPLPENNAPPTPSAGDVARESATSTLSSKLGGLGGMMGGLGRKKKQEPQPEPEKSAAAAPPATTVFMESSTEMSGFSSSKVPEAVFALPQGYRQVEYKSR